LKEIPEGMYSIPCVRSHTCYRQELLNDSLVRRRK